MFLCGTLTACACCVAPAERGVSGKRQTCAETELGRQRDEYREGDRRWETGSGKHLCLTFSFLLNKTL